MAKHFVKKLLPDRDKIADNKMLRFLGPTLLHPDLWHISRRSIAIGLAVGLFFGFLIPVAQIPAAAIVAVFLRANLAIAAVSTLVTNPFTFAPIYFLAYQVGALVIGDSKTGLSKSSIEQATQFSIQPTGWFDQILGLGAPTFLGLFIFAVVSAAIAYFGVNLAWRLGVNLRKHRRRKHARLAKAQARTE
jgi:uncharacterized protein